MKNGDFDSLQYVVFRFSGTLSIASAGSINPDWDLYGERIQDLANDKHIQGLTYGIVLDETGFAVVFSWPRNFDLMTDFIGHMMRLEESNLSTAIILFMFAYSENTYFSNSWWNSLRSTQRMRLKTLALTPIQYGSPVNYKGSRMVDWQLKEIVTAK